jgi:hypothetical protein
MVIKTVLFGLLDLIILLVMIRWIFQTPGEFFNALWRARKPPFGFGLLAFRDKNGDRKRDIDVGGTLMILAILIWAEKTFFY